MPVVSKNKKVFKNYPYLPIELRMMVIDEMEAMERCLFMQCSQRSQTEARASKNFLYELKVRSYSMKDISIHVNFGAFRGFYLKFENKAGKLRMSYCTLCCKELWAKKFESITNWVQFAIQHFKNILQMHQNTVKSLVLSGPIISSYLKKNDFDIRSLNRLEALDIPSDIDPSQIFSKIRQPLKNLYCFEKGNSELLRNDVQIYKVTNYLHLPDLQLNYDLFLQLSASHISIHIGVLTVQNIVEFIKTWQNGTIRDNIKTCEWQLNYSKFEKSKLFKIFGVAHRDSEIITSNIKHDQKPWKKATLRFYFFKNSIEFEVNGRN